MRIGLLSVGIVAIIFGLVYGIVMWNHYQAADVRLGCIEAKYARSDYERTQAYEKCEENRSGSRTIMFILFSIAGIGLVLVIYSFFVKRVEEPGITEFLE